MYSCVEYTNYPQVCIYVLHEYIENSNFLGLYFPCIGRLRGETIPDNLRANIMNWFRVPMNVIT